MRVGSWSQQRDDEPEGRSDAVAEQVGRAANDLREEGDRVLCHELVGDGAVDIGPVVRGLRRWEDSPRSSNSSVHFGHAP